MALSPSTLFHFTNKTGLKGILADNFHIKYCLEEIDHLEKPVEMAIPMVSFCDIKLSEIKDHIEKYGNYGIGLSKSWAIEQGLNPVFYLNTNSSLPNSLISTIRRLREKIDAEDYYNLSNVIRYAKKYEGPLKRHSKILKNYRFADEREWRYVPEMKLQDPDFANWLTKKHYDTKEKKLEANARLASERLVFNANQIMYIVVKEEEEITEIIQYIRNVKGKNYTMEEVDRLNTRILSCERVFNDF